MNNHQRRNLLTTEFEQRFGGTPALWAQAPGRVDLMGSHTDYNQGYVLTLSIDRDTWIAARPRDDERVSVCSLNVVGCSEFSLDNISHDDTTPWTNYIRGIATVLQAEGYPLCGFDGLIHSTIPFASGLSSSAAIEMATITIFQMLGDWNIDPVSMALLGQKTENKFVGVNCGILDQYTSALGQAGCALILDCRDLTSRVAALPENLQVVICDTQAQRELTGSEYDERRAQCETGAELMGVDYLRDVSPDQFSAGKAELPEVVRRRCQFIIEENQRVLDLAKAFSNNDLPAISKLTAQSFTGARDLYQIVSPEMEAMMAAMLGAAGVLGARQAGAGFGGCMVAFVEKPAVELFAAQVKQAYTLATGIEPNVYPVQAAAGAGPLQFPK